MEYATQNRVGRENRLDFQPVFRLLWRERLRVGAAVLGAGIVALAITFAMPEWFKANAVIMPPEESSLLGNMSMAQRALTKFPIFGILEDYYTPADIYKAILLSRSVQEEIINQFDLKRVYKQKSMEKTIKELKNHYSAKLQPDGTILVSAEDRDPRRAAKMANAFLAALDRYNVERRNSQARRTRMFLEQRVAETDSTLRLSEAVLRLYQEKHGTVAPMGASAAPAQAAADLMARKTMLEVRLGMLRSYLRDDNDQVVQTQLELGQLKSQIGSLPALQNEMLRMIRDQKIQEQLYLLLTSELEQSRVQETMDTPTVSVLDPAVPPERHSSPRRGIITLGAMVIAMAGSVVWAARRLAFETA